jgi:hypothetical protein
MRAALLILFLAGYALAAEKMPDPAAPSSFVIGISPYLDDNVKDEVPQYRSPAGPGPAFE